MPSPLGTSTLADSAATVNLLQIALDQSVSGIVVYEAVRDVRGDIRTYRVVLMNRRAERSLGLTRADVLNQTVDTIFPSATTAELWRNVGKVIETGESMRYDYFYNVQRTGLAAWFDLCIEPVGDGQRAVVSFADISDIRAARQALLSDSLLFRTLSSTVPETGVIVTDYFKKIIIANGVLPGLLVETDPGLMQGQLLENIVLPEFREEWRNYLGTALRGESHFFSDHWAGWRCEVYVGPVRNEQGAVVMILVVFRNVTEQYRQQQALIQSNLSLEQSNHSLEQFAYVASHDLQEPLRKIRSFGDLLRNSYGQALDESGIDLIARMQAASERMSTLIQSLLAYARLSSEQRSPSTVHLGDLFSDLMSDLSVTIQERQGVVRLKPPLPIIPGDEQQLRQLFQNLLTNALKFVPADRTPIITVSARVVEGPHVPNVAAAADATYAEVNIQDNGIGIEKDYYDKIFGLFNRLHGRKQYEGTGIGLATTKKVVENHNGTITLDSEVGVGTTFHVYLPINSMQ